MWEITQQVETFWPAAIQILSGFASANVRINLHAESKKAFSTSTPQGWKSSGWTATDGRYPFLCLTFLFSALRIPDSFRVKTENGLTIAIANVEGQGQHQQEDGKGKNYIQMCAPTMRVIHRERKAAKIGEAVTIEDKEEAQ